MTQSKNVLVTGATRGVGLAISRRLVKDGYRLIGLSRQESEEYRDLTKTAEIGQVSFVRFDLSNLGDISSLVKQVILRHGPLYGLVNNAGLGLDGILATMHPSDISKALRINLEAPILLSKFACRSMLVQGEGRIINISSIIAETGFSGLSVYGASKAGLMGFSRSLARELGRAGVTVNCVMPGFMATDMTVGLQGEKLESVQRRAPLGLASPADAAGAVSYLLSEDGVRVTGTSITVDGGSTA